MPNPQTPPLSVGEPADDQSFTLKPAIVIETFTTNDAAVVEIDGDNDRIQLSFDTDFPGLNGELALRRYNTVVDLEAAAGFAQGILDTVAERRRGLHVVRDPAEAQRLATAAREIRPPGR